jgi:hypothetical protein
LKVEKTMVAFHFASRKSALRGGASRVTVRALALLSIALIASLLAACGGGETSVDIGGNPPPAQINKVFAGTAVVKVRSNAHGFVALEERLTSLFEIGPMRRLNASLQNSAASGVYQAPAGWILLDFALHPSGDMTAIIATEKTLQLVRLDRNARVLHELPLTDSAANTDPYIDLGGSAWFDSMLPRQAKDTARLAPLGEDVAVALRTGRHALVAYRYNQGAAGFTRAWRTLVEPGTTILGRFVTSGSYDTFDQLVNHFKVFLDTDANGNLAIAATGNGHSGLFEAHTAHFGEAAAADFGALVTRVTANGQRLGTTLVNTTQVSEVQGLRYAGGNVGLVGRVRTERRDDGTGWDGYLAVVSGTSGANLAYRVVNIQAGDVLFDVVPLPQGRYLVAGATGYAQNPSGASITESTEPLLAVLEADGSLRARLSFTGGSRQNQLRSLAERAGSSGWLVGGLTNGPGTHSGDGNAALITADGFIRETTVAVP